MGKALVDLPPRNHISSFLHPESRELILALAAAGFAFSFWDTINIKPSLLTDETYADQKDGIYRNMNMTLLIIGSLATGLGAVYRKEGYLPAILMFGTGAGMYLWSASELSRLKSTTQTYSNSFERSDISSQEQYADNLPAAFSTTSVLYTPMAAPRTDFQTHQRRRRDAML